MYIYKFTHIESGKSYIGQTIQDPNRRRFEHIYDSRHTTKVYHFHNAIRKYGIDAFTFEIIDTANSLEELNLLEEHYANHYDCYTNGYNIRKAGGNKLHSTESKQRMSESQKLAHARRRAQNNGIETHPTSRSHKGKTGLWNLSNEQKKKHSETMSEVNKKTSGGKTWKIINGKRTWITKEASA